MIRKKNADIIKTLFKCVKIIRLKPIMGRRFYLPNKKHIASVKKKKKKRTKTNKKTTKKHKTQKKNNNSKKNQILRCEVRGIRKSLKKMIFCYFVICIFFSVIIADNSTFKTN